MAEMRHGVALIFECAINSAKQHALWTLFTDTGECLCASGYMCKTGECPCALNTYISRDPWRVVSMVTLCSSTRWCTEHIGQKFRAWTKWRVRNGVQTQHKTQSIIVDTWTRLIKNTRERLEGTSTNAIEWRVRVTCQLTTLSRKRSRCGRAKAPPVPKSTEEYGGQRRRFFYETQSDAKSKVYSREDNMRVCVAPRCMR